MQCGLHHPANTVPACSVCNGSRDQAKGGGRLTWEQHLQNLGKAQKWTPATVEKRRRLIQEFVRKGGYPELTSEEMAYLQTTARALYQDVIERVSSDVSGFVKIHGECAVRVSKESKTADRRGNR